MKVLQNTYISIEEYLEKLGMHFLQFTQAANKLGMDNLKSSVCIKNINFKYKRKYY